MGAIHLTKARRRILVSNCPIISSLKGSVDARPAWMMKKGMSSIPAKREKVMARAVMRRQ